MTAYVPGIPSTQIPLTGLVPDSGLTDNAAAVVAQAVNAGFYFAPPVTAGGYYGISEIDLPEGVWIVGAGHHPSKSPGNSIPPLGQIYGSNFGPAKSSAAGFAGFTNCIIGLSGKGSGLANIGVFGNYDRAYAGANQSVSGIPFTNAGSGTGLASAVIVSGLGCQTSNVFTWGGMASLDQCGLVGGNAADGVFSDHQINQLLNTQGIGLGGGTWNSSTQVFTLIGAMPAGVTVGMLITAGGGDGLLPMGSYISAMTSSTVTVTNRYGDSFPSYNGWTHLTVDPYWIVVQGAVFTSGSFTINLPTGYTTSSTSFPTITSTNQFDGWSIFSGDSAGVFPAVAPSTLIARGGATPGASGTAAVTLTNKLQQNKGSNAGFDLVAARSFGGLSSADTMTTGKLSIEGGTGHSGSADLVNVQAHVSCDNATSRGSWVSQTAQGPTFAASVFDGAHPFEFQIRRDYGLLHVGPVRLMNGNGGNVTGFPNTVQYTVPNCSTTGTNGVITLTSGTVPSGVAVGQVITGTNIPANSAVGSFTTNSITLGNSVNTSGAGSGLTMSIGTVTNCVAIVDNGVDARSVQLSNAVAPSVGSDGYRSIVRFTANATPAIAQILGLFTDANTLQAGTGTTFGGLYLGGNPGKVVSHWANGSIQPDISGGSLFATPSVIIGSSFAFDAGAGSGPTGGTWSGFTFTFTAGTATAAGNVVTFTHNLGVAPSVRLITGENNSAALGKLYFSSVTSSQIIVAANAAITASAACSFDLYVTTS